MALFTILIGSVLINAIPAFAESAGYSTPSSDQFQTLKDQFYVAQGRLSSVFESIFGSLIGVIAQQNAQLQNNNSHTSEDSSSTSTQTVSYNSNDTSSQTTNENDITVNQTESDTQNQESDTQNQTEYTTPNQNENKSEIYVNDTSNMEPAPVLSISADKSSYTFGDTATITAELSGYGAGEYVAVTVINPSGDNIVSRTITTDEHGYANLEFKIPESYEIGTYQVIATAFAGGMTYKASTEFTVEPQSPNISIVSVQATDQHGDPVTSFEKGTTGYAKVVVSSQSSQTALVTVDPFDANYASLGVGSVKTTLGAGKSEILVSFFVPKDAASGTANIYADIFSDWPSNGGTPLTGEASSTVEIR